MSLQREEPAICINVPAPHPAPAVDNASHTTARGVEGRSPDSQEEDGKSQGEGTSGPGKKRVRLSTDREKAHLIRLCIDNFGRFGEGREKFFQYIGQLFEKEFDTKAPNVKSWINRREHERRKEVEVGRRAVAESEWGQTMDSWLALVRDYEESKAAGASEKRRRMNKNRRKSRPSQSPPPSMSEEYATLLFALSSSSFPVIDSSSKWALLHRYRRRKFLTAMTAGPTAIFNEALLGGVTSEEDGCAVASALNQTSSSTD